MDIKNLSTQSPHWHAPLPIPSIPTCALILSLGYFLMLGGCASFKKNSGYDLEKQIERQQIQQEMSSEIAANEKKSAAEYEDLGDRYFLKGDINRAYLYYLKGLGEEPGNISLLQKRGALLLKKKKFVEAEVIFEEVLASDSNNLPALEGKGRAYFGQARYTEAEQLFLAVVAAKPDQWQSHEYLGLIYSRRKNYTQAINRFKTALAYQPVNMRISNNLAVTYYLAGNFNEAVRLYQVVVKKTKNRKIYNNLALAYFQLGLYEEALDSFKKGAETEALAYNNMGYEYLTHKKYSQAIQAFEKAIALYPRFYPVAEKNLTIARQEMGLSVSP